MLHVDGIVENLLDKCLWLNPSTATFWQQAIMWRRKYAVAVNTFGHIVHRTIAGGGNHWTCIVHHIGHKAVIRNCWSFFFSSSIDENYLKKNKRKISSKKKQNQKSSQFIPCTNRNSNSLKYPKDRPCSSAQVH